MSYLPVPQKSPSLSQDLSRSAQVMTLNDGRSMEGNTKGARPVEESSRTGTTAVSSRFGRTTSAPSSFSVSELKFSEKLSIISGKSLWFLADLPRLKIPSIRVSDGPHGVRKPIKDLSLQRSFPATCFPTAAAIACSWDPNVAKAVGRALRVECIYYNVHVLLGPGVSMLHA